MTVYVDNALLPYGRMLMCHMVASTKDELHQMADSIGIARRWYQDKGRYHHYDICKAKRALAIKNGAVEVTGKQLIIFARQMMQPVVPIGGREVATFFVVPN